MTGTPAMFSIDTPKLIRNIAVATIAIGVGIWGALLLAPVPGALPPALDSSPVKGQDTAAVARWFGGEALRIRVTVAGLIAGGPDRGAALLGVNGAAPQAYRIGQTLAPGVTLSGVAANGVFIDQDGAIEQVSMPNNPANEIQGFISVTPSVRDSSIAAPSAGQ
jgi:general secretion pathway protein C